MRKVPTTTHSVYVKIITLRQCGQAKEDVVKKETVECSQRPGDKKLELRLAKECLKGLTPILKLIEVLPFDLQQDTAKQKEEGECFKCLNSDADVVPANVVESATCNVEQILKDDEDHPKGIPVLAIRHEI